MFGHNTNLAHKTYGGLIRVLGVGIVIRNDTQQGARNIEKN
jgi:hypothetical protein